MIWYYSNEGIKLLKETGGRDCFLVSCGQTLSCKALIINYGDDKHLCEKGPCHARSVYSTLL